MVFCTFKVNTAYKIQHFYFLKPLCVYVIFLLEFSSRSKSGLYVFWGFSALLRIRVHSPDLHDRPVFVAGAVLRARNTQQGAVSLDAFVALPAASPACPAFTAAVAGRAVSFVGVCICASSRLRAPGGQALATSPGPGRVHSRTRRPCARMRRALRNERPLRLVVNR